MTSGVHTPINDVTGNDGRISPRGESERASGGLREGKRKRAQAVAGTPGQARTRRCQGSVGVISSSSWSWVGGRICATPTAIQHFLFQAWAGVTSPSCTTSIRCTVDYCQAAARRPDPHAAGEPSLWEHGRLAARKPYHLVPHFPTSTSHFNLRNPQATESAIIMAIAVSFLGRA